MERITDVLDKHSIKYFIENKIIKIETGDTVSVYGDYFIRYNNKIKNGNFFNDFKEYVERFSKDRDVLENIALTVKKWGYNPEMCIEGYVFFRDKFDITYRIYPAEKQKNIIKVFNNSINIKKKFCLSEMVGDWIKEFIEKREIRYKAGLDVNEHIDNMPTEQQIAIDDKINKLL